MSLRPAHHLAVCLSCCLAAATMAQAAEVVIDNSDAGFSVTGTWSTGTTASGKYGTNYRYASTASSVGAQAQWQPDLPEAAVYEVSVWYPAGSQRISDARYRVYHNAGDTAVTINQTVSAGQWVSLGTYSFAAGSSSAGRVILTNQSSQSGRRVYADAVRFKTLDPPALTMAVSPAGAGSTVPAAGGPYPRTLNEVVAIAATPAAGYVFDRWTVSAGSDVASPTSASTTVTMDVAKTVTAVFRQPEQPEFRAFWADVFHYGLQTAAQVDEMIAKAVEGNYNAIVPQVLAYHDNQVGSHGAYWRSNIVARSSWVTSTFDPLGYIIQRAHANGLQVHCWLVAFRVSSVWPPPGNSFLAGHPEWLKVPLANIGTVAPNGSYYEFDPGSPGVQDYLASVVRELATDYEIDGIHWDYIRYTRQDSGYPADLNYADSTLKRFQRITGRSDVPPATGDAQWDDFRRRTVSEVVRRITWELPLITSNPRQPLRYTAAVVTWAPSNINFHLTRPYYETYSDWEDWMQRGFLDASVPMCYFDEDGSYTQTYRDWVTNTVAWRYGRHAYIGPGIYMNSFANSLTQLEYARAAGADGYCTYSYQVTADTSTLWSELSQWYPYIATNFSREKVAVPNMPWRDPATATEGTLYGRVTDASTGLPVDDVTVGAGGYQAQTDAAGYYVLCRLPSAGAGATYTVTAARAGYPTASLENVPVLPGGVQRADLALGGTAPSIPAHPGTQVVCPLATASFSVTAAGDAPLAYRWQKNGEDLFDGPRITGSSSATLTITGVETADAGTYRCIVSNAAGNAESDPADLVLKTVVAADFNADCAVNLADFEIFNACATGPSIPYAAGALPSGCALTPVGDRIAADFDADGDVDMSDFGAFQRCYGTVGEVEEAGCAN